VESLQAKATYEADVSWEPGRVHKYFLSSVAHQKSYLVRRRSQGKQLRSHILLSEETGHLREAVGCSPVKRVATMSERIRPAKRSRAPVEGASANQAKSPLGLKGGVAKKPAASGKGGGGLLAGILGDLEETQKKIGKTKPTAKHENIAGSAATAYAQRQLFVSDIEKQLREYVLNSSDPNASRNFPPMEKKWRDLIHETASDLKLHSSSQGEEEDKYVVVSKLSAHNNYQARPAAARIVVGRGEKKKEALSELAPTADVGNMAKLNTNKRDLRTIEQIQADMRAGK